MTYGETKALILFGITAKGKTLQDHLETFGHDEAVKWLIDIVKSEETLKEWCENVLPYLAEKFIEVNEKFKGFYVEREYHLLHYTSQKADDDYFNAVETTTIFNKENLEKELINNAKKSIEFILHDYDSFHHTFNLICKDKTFVEQELSLLIMI